MILCSTVSFRRHFLSFSFWFIHVHDELFISSHTTSQLSGLNKPVNVTHQFDTRTFPAEKNHSASKSSCFKGNEKKDTTPSGIKEEEAVCFIITGDDREPIDRPSALSALKRAHWSGGSQWWDDGGAEWLKHQRQMKKTSLFLWEQPSHQDSFNLHGENECSLFLSVMDSRNECTLAAECTSLEIIPTRF